MNWLLKKFWELDVRWREVDQIKIYPLTAGSVYHVRLMLHNKIDLFLGNKNYMTDLINMEIGGVNFAIFSRSATHFHKLEPAYRSFLGELNDYPSLKPADIEIRSGYIR